MSASQVSRLTPEQRKLFDSAPGIARAAAQMVWDEVGASRWGHLTFDELVSIATIAALEATTTYDPARAPSYRTWAYYAGVYAIFRAGRDQRAQYVKEKALIRAKILTDLACTDEEMELGWDTQEAIEGRLHSFTHSVIDVAMKIVASMPPAETCVDQVVEHETAASVGDALRELMPAPGSAERTMLEMRFTQQMPLTQVAEAMGVGKSGYATFVRHFHKLLAKIREGLAARGITELPPWLDDVSGQALGDGG